MGHFLPISRSLSPPHLTCMTVLVLLHGIRVVAGIFWWGASLPKWKGWSFKWPCMEAELWRKLWTEAKTRGIQILQRRHLKTMPILAPPHFVWLNVKPGCWRKRKGSQQLCEMMTDWEWVRRSSAVFYLMKHLTGADSSHWVKMT